MVLGMLWCIAWAWGGWACTRSSSILLDSQNNTVTFSETSILFGRMRHAIPLDQVRHAQIATTDGAERIVLVLKSGRYEGFTAYTDQAGQEEAVQAINDFWGVGNR